MADIQTRFLKTISPAHRGEQNFLHQDHHLHLADSDGNILKRNLFQQNHIPLDGQTTLDDFELRKKFGW